MKVGGAHYRSIWFETESRRVMAIDQIRLPHEFATVVLDDLEAACHAIRAMQVRGAPLIGAAAAFGLYLALRERPDSLEEAGARLAATRPTAVNLQWALARVARAVRRSAGEPAEAALHEALNICEEDVANCSRIGDHGLALLRRLQAEKGGRLELMTHCNAGWLATVDWGTALAPVYKAFDAGIPLHVWVGETRPRNQGASLTAWELAGHGIPHTVISDNAAGHLMRQGRVDLCLVGSDRTTRRGDVCNKIGTYLKALAAHDNGLPFYVALPVSSIDWEADEVPIEERDPEEVTHIRGLNSQGRTDTIRLTPPGSPASNYAFDVTPGRLVSGLITEHGVVGADEAGLAQLREVVLKQQAIDPEEPKQQPKQTQSSEQA